MSQIVVYVVITKLAELASGQLVQLVSLNKVFTASVSQIVL